MIDLSKIRMRGSGVRAWWYIAVALLPVLMALYSQLSMQMQLQQMRDQIMNPMQQMPNQMQGPQMQAEQNRPGFFRIPGFNNASAIPDNLAPIDLPIENISQETQVWCWAAVSQQIIAASRGREQTPPQCELVATANNAPAEFCCAGRDPRCVTTGSLQQVQGLIQHYGGRTSSYAEPTDAMTLYKTLQQGHAVVIGIDMGQGMGHVVVARGMSFQQTPQGTVALVHINDPMAQFTQPVPFDKVAAIWRQAIIIN